MEGLTPVLEDLVSSGSQVTHMDQKKWELDIKKKSIQPK